MVDNLKYLLQVEREKQQQMMEKFTSIKSGYSYGDESEISLRFSTETCLFLKE